MFAASDQSRDDLCNAALLALVGVSHQALHVRPQQRKEDIAEIAEQSLEEQEKGTDECFYWLTVAGFYS